jgi:Homeodomain-like domain
MAGKSGLARLIMSAEQKEELTRLSNSRAAPAREVQRVQILCRFAAGETVTEIARALKTTRPSVQKWVIKALAMGASAALKDTFHRPHAPVITEEARAWVVHLACSKPKDHGYAAELWTRSLLARHVRQHAA